MSVTISLSALVCMACLFTPKLYIILVRPERNVRQSMMAANRSGLGKPPATGSTSMMSTVLVTVTTCNQKEKIQRHMSIVEAKASQFSDDLILNNNNNNSQSLNNNNTTMSFDKSTQTHMDCGECKLASQKLLKEKSIAVETQTDFINLHNESICCLNRIPYADMTENSPPCPRSFSYQGDVTKTGSDDLNESFNESKQDDNNQNSVTTLQNVVENTSVLVSSAPKEGCSAGKFHSNKGVGIL